jgi:energy-coupling factor transport system ATP-binding protein
VSFRPAPLKVAAALAAGFVAVRVIYRVLFHGADGSGAVLLALPEVRLPAPFAHVVMFGPITTGGVWDAAASALPIALMILLFGLLNALFDVARLFARGSRRGPLRGVARALAVAWATLPALTHAVGSVRFAQRLRGERAGVRILALLQLGAHRAVGDHDPRAQGVQQRCGPGRAGDARDVEVEAGRGGGGGHRVILAAGAVSARGPRHGPK